MAGSKKRVDHVAWQIEVANNDEWEELTKLQGLVVVDVYSEWCGPCSAMASHLKEIKLQLGDDFLHCAIAKSDGIDQLASFRGRSEPTWLFLAGGEPVALVRGANAPLIRTTLLEELEAEKQVIQGNRQRTVMAWDSFDFGAGEQSDEQPSEANTESDKLPENWTELDGLVLQGSFRLILDQFVESCKAHPLEIAHRSAVQIDQTESLVLWFPSTLEEDKLVEWVEETMNGLIAEAEPKPEPEPAAETEPNGEASEDVEEQPQTPTAAPEAPDYTPITFKLVTDHSEKEALIQKVTTQAAEAAEAAAASEAAQATEETEPGEQLEEQGNQPENQPEDQAEEGQQSEEVQEEPVEEPEPSHPETDGNVEEPASDPA